MNPEVRYKAAAAVVALANRAESAGFKEAASAKGAQWLPMPFNADRRMNPGKLREAVTYYEIAESISREAAGWGYPRALLLENMGAWDQAIAAFDGLAGTPYAQPGRMGSERCASKRAGTFQEFDVSDDPDGVEEDVEPGLDVEADDALAAKVERMAASAMAAARTSGPDTDVDDDATLAQQASETALVFVNHLLDRDYRAAQAMLHPHESGMTADELRDEFEPMFEGEDFPNSANVFDVQTDMPTLELDDLAWVYVSIDSDNQEAVSLHVARDRGRLVVRQVEFGRP